MEIAILRLSHRPFRDKRITTHVFLAARAFGATKGIYSGEKDSELEERINKISQNFGGNFSISYEKNWRGIVEKWKTIGKVVHLTMYGVPFEDAVKIMKTDNLLIVVGGEKVPSGLYKLADFNVSITTQPHSEVSALGVFLYKMVDFSKVANRFKGGRIRIIPTASGKNIVNF